MQTNGLMFQYFDSAVKADGSLWRDLKKDAPMLKKNGVTSVWMPPAWKGVRGGEDSGYGVYDLYDLGEFRQKGSVRTRYGTKKEYLEAIQAVHDEGMQAYAEVFFSSFHGADKIEEVPAEEINSTDNCQMIGDGKVVGALTGFTFPGRKGKYSNFKWDHTMFSGIDWNREGILERLIEEEGEESKTLAAIRKKNYEFLMDARLNFSSQEVYDRLVAWAVWYLAETGVDGFCLNKTEDIPASFYRDFLIRVRELTGKELFTVANHSHWDAEKLADYLEEIKLSASLFDTPLHYNFYNCAKAHGAYDLRTLFSGTMSERNPLKAVTFVDNNNSEPGGIRDSYVEEWFKPMAYASILLRESGYPCIFYGDYKGIPEKKIKSKKQLLDKLMKLRKMKAYGTQHDYLDDPDVIGWTREGDADHKDSGLAVVLSDGRGGTKRMYIGRQFAGKHFSDVMGNAKYNIKIDQDGFGEFYVNRGAVSVWVHKEPKAEA